MTHNCGRCGKPFEGNVRAVYCSTTCRAGASKARKAGTPVQVLERKVVEQGAADGANVLATRAQLEKLGKIDDPLGAMALTAAARLDQGDTGSSMAALMKELRTLLVEVAKGSTAVVDAVDDLAERRRQRRGA